MPPSIQGLCIGRQRHLVDAVGARDAPATSCPSALVPLVPTKRPESEQPPSGRGVRIAHIGAGATTVAGAAALTALVGWPGLVSAIVFGLIRGAVAMIERIAVTRKVWAEAGLAITQACADVRVADALRMQTSQDKSSGLRCIATWPSG
jgi:hypothetical protein